MILQPGSGLGGSQSRELGLHWEWIPSEAPPAPPRYLWVAKKRSATDGDIEWALRTVLASTYKRGVLTDGEVLLPWIATVDTIFGADLLGSLCRCKVNPTAQTVLSIEREGDPMGSITISTGGAATFSTGHKSFLVKAGEELTITGPATADDTLAGVTITLAGVVD